MAEQIAKSKLHALLKKWVRVRLLYHCLIVCSISMLIGAFLILYFNAGLFLISASVVLVALLDYLLFFQQLNESDVVVFLNKTLPGVEESSGLILKSHHELNRLEQLQLNKIAQALEQDIALPATLVRQLRVALVMLVISVLACTMIFLLPLNQTVTGNTVVVANESPSSGRKSGPKPPRVGLVQVIIAPPAYTGNKSREQQQFDIVAEEGARVTWNITTNNAVKSVRMLFNDNLVIAMNRVNKAANKWSFSKRVTKPGFYQLKIEGILSELYKIELINDRLPEITVRSPEPSTLIEPGQPNSITVSGTVNDDYGLRSLFLSATIARGSGEAVTFKEQKMAVPRFASGSKVHTMQQRIDLGALGMKPGDELYFYLSATDNQNQEKRSDIFIVRLEDTAQLMSIEGMASGVDIQPEFFRSQRQIIIETEQLLRMRDTISAEAFKNKSNDLGTDQKLLRLRYGKFLGEETDAEIGGSHDHEEEGHAGDESFGNVEQMMEGYMHKHDNAEDATFFDAQTKKQLKATLAEMWKSELQLRTIKPKDALPFEYKALKLLKELQQQTRVYVAKTGSKTTPLKPEKRLTGDLGKIVQPTYQQDVTSNTTETDVLRKALGVLEQVRSREKLQIASTEVLRQATIQLGTRAAEQPSKYLSSLQALRRIMANKFSPQDITVAGKGLQSMIVSVRNIPYPSPTRPDMKLSQQYFRNLNRMHD